MPRRKKKPQPQPLEPLVPRFAFGKFRGRTVNEVMQVESSYLAWFMGQVDGCEELKETIKSHPRFSAVWKSYQECRRKNPAEGGMAAGTVLAADHRQPVRRAVPRGGNCGTIEDHQGGPLREVRAERREPELRQGRGRTVSLPGVRGGTSPPRVRALVRHARDRPVGGVFGDPARDGLPNVLLRRIRRRVAGRQVLGDAEACPAGDGEAIAFLRLPGDSRMRSRG